MEEFAARFLRGDYFFMWQVDPTVIFGRNQVPDRELDIAYCRAAGVEFYRRKSGGGCVYADRNNIMFSHITDCSEVQTTFGGFTGRVAAMLRGLGIAEARTGGRNDILIGNDKVSGYAFYHVKRTGADSTAYTGNDVGGRAIVHGTMLYEADLDAMARALTPSATKLAAKGVDSVHSRVTTIKAHSPITLDDFKHTTAAQLCDSSLELTEQQVNQIRLIERTYYTPEWTFGRHNLPHPDLVQRIEGAGEFAVTVALHPASHAIDRVELTGDFFLTAPLQPLLDAMTGAAPEAEALERALGSVDVSAIVPGLDAATLASMVVQATHNSQSA